ncbi:hypothetical protein ABB37_05998 [Leptomonas pyrrhocoris]|uniref:Leucine-rich repeat protein (LRRP) n=1 Tax=Leptomonas pyrrhocoris TaxID=157538 RepID=A0A0N0DUH4_LEPPY|nr:hypothetical protein ABB37_05998 [Leptomonas pyrrhocoris]KPA78934.1 hypothetical protein ABB37_05998 [Leptomonas pyrrhocoris]|eukprot:XP_015657373.1 hypothetical protein ABB37_05998 [Leptomonas pyrrhocoris]
MKSNKNCPRRRIPRAQLTDILQYTPHIPSICCAAAHPHLRYARETVAGTRADHIVHHRGNLYVCWDRTTSREYHNFTGVEGEMAADLKMMAWWLTRPFHDSGDPMILEVNVKKQTPSFSAAAAESTTSGLESVLRILTAPPYQQVDAGVSCLRSLILTPNRLEVTAAVRDLIGQLTHLEKLECFSHALALPLPAVPSAYVLKLRNLTSLTSITPLLPFSRLRKLSLCRCSELRSVAALAALPDLTEVRLANCRVLDLEGDYAACRHLTSFSMRWCGEVLHVGALATLPHLRELDCSYCGLREVGGLAGCAELRQLSLRGCQTVHELFSVNLTAAEGATATQAAAEAFDTTTSTSAATTPTLASPSLSMRGEAASLLHNSSSSAFEASRSAPVLPSTPMLGQLVELDVGESSLASLAGVTLRAPGLQHLTVRECKHLHSLSPLGGLPSLTSVDASFSGISELKGLSDSFSLEYVNLKNCSQLSSVAPLAKVSSLREVDLSVLHHNCIVCIDDPKDHVSSESAAAQRRRGELQVLSPPLRSIAADETQIDTAVMQRSNFGLWQHCISRKQAATLLSQSLNDVRTSVAGSTPSVW